MMIQPRSALCLLGLSLAVAFGLAGCEGNGAPKPAPTVAALATLPDLGDAETYVLLAGTSVTNNGLSVIDGDVGVSPGSSIAGFPPGVLTGSLHAADAPAANAQSDLTTAYNDLAGQACDTVLTGVDLGGMTLSPAVYCFATSAQLTGTVTLDGLGDPNAVFVFQVASTLTTASSSVVATIGDALPGRVFWQVGSSATLGTGTAFAGNILALVSITATTGSNIRGRALARTGAVTVDTIEGEASPLVPPLDGSVEDASDDASDDADMDADDSLDGQVPDDGSDDDAGSVKDGGSTGGAPDGGLAGGALGCAVRADPRGGERILGLLVLGMLGVRARRKRR